MEKKDLMYNYNEIQKEVIKSILFQQSSIPAVSEIISSDDFSNDKYRAIYISCLELYSLKEKITQATLFNHLKETKNIDLTLDDAILFTSPPLDPPTSLAEILKKKSVVNTAIDMYNTSIKELSESNTPLETLGKTQAESAKLSYRLNSGGEKTLEEEVLEIKEDILKDKGEEVYVIPSPYESLNKYINKGFMPEQLVTVGARTGIGKALDIRTPILTKDGWKTMKDINVGDIVYGKDGKETKVIFATEIQYNRECYKLHFSNHDTIIADAEHLWELYKHNKSFILKTEEILDDYNNYFIYKPLKIKDKEIENQEYFYTNEDNKIYINNIEKIESIPVKCIQVDNEDHIYLAGKSLIPTHNTVVATQCAATACALGKSVLFFSLEMSGEQLIKRIAACYGNIMLSLLKPRNDRDEDTKQKISEVMDEISNWKLKIVDEPDVTMEKIRSISQQTAQSENGLDMIIIDYLQLISTKGSYNRNRQETVAEISRGCKMMAKELGVPVMVLVQLNRELKGEAPDRLPGKEDIRESAAIAADSDIVLIIHRKNKDDSTDPKALFILDKNREGASDKKFLMRCVLEKNIFQDLKKEAASLNESDFFGSQENGESEDKKEVKKEPPTDFGNVQDVKDWGLEDNNTEDMSDNEFDSYDIFGDM